MIDVSATARIRIASGPTGDGANATGLAAEWTLVDRDTDRVAGGSSLPALLLFTPAFAFAFAYFFFFARTGGSHRGDRLKQ